MGKQQTLQVFKVLNTTQNQNLITEVYDCYANQNSITNVQRAKLGVATCNATFDNLEKLAVNTDDVHIIYVCVADNKIVSTFTHMYDAVSHEMYLYESNTHESKQQRGYGTAFYKEIIKDIFSSPEVYDICASAMSDGGRRLLSNLGFEPNTLAYSYGGNSILYSPNYNLSPAMVRLEVISQLAPDRDFTNAPNVDAYNEVLKGVMLAGKYNETKEIKSFKRGHSDYLKHKAKKMLKNKTSEPIQIVEKSENQTSMPNIVFTFSPTSGIETEVNTTANEIAHNLQILHEAKKVTNQGLNKGK